MAAMSEQEAKGNLGTRAWGWADDRREDSVKHPSVMHIFLLIPFEMIFLYECEPGCRHK